MQRPTGVTILAVLAFLAAGMWLILSLLYVVAGVMPSRGSAMSTGLGDKLIITYIVALPLAPSALCLMTGVGLWRLRNWGRVLAILLAGLSLLGYAIALAGPLAHTDLFFGFVFLVMGLVYAAIDAGILVYLFRPRVKQAFGATGF
jgi:uncharacterized membrane protein (DUF2068 family)